MEQQMDTSGLEGGAPGLEGGAPTLSKRKKRKNMRQKKKDNKAKNVLTNPVVTAWPPLTAEGEESIIALMKSALGTYDLRPSGRVLQEKIWRNAPTKDAEDRRREIGEYDEQRPWEERNLRAQLVFGNNAVMHQLQSDQLQVVVASRDLWQMNKPVAELCMARQCPALGILNLQALCTLVHGGKVTALGFRKLQEGDNKHFQPLVDFLKTKAKPFDTPWAPAGSSMAGNPGQQAPAQGIGSPGPSPSPSQRQPGPSPQPASGSGPADPKDAWPGLIQQKTQTIRQKTKNYSHLYVFKDGAQQSEPQAMQTARTGDYTQDVGTGFGDDDFVGFADGADNFEMGGQGQSDWQSGNKRSGGHFDGSMAQGGAPKTMKLEGQNPEQGGFEGKKKKKKKGRNNWRNWKRKQRDNQQEPTGMYNYQQPFVGQMGNQYQNPGNQNQWY